ncbi:MAG: SdpI family protein [Lachnospiraceae bacterium]|nr:SdpI family protein [Lachnospiraceae bacterium]
MFTYYIWSYLPILMVMLYLPFLPAEVTLFESISLHKFWLMLPVLACKVVSSFFDKQLAMAKLKDVQELEDGTPNGGLNFSSMMFFAKICLLLMFVLCVGLLTAAYYRVGRIFPEVTMQNACQVAGVAAGIVIAIYGRFMPLVPYGSIMGIPSTYTMKSEENWRKAHQACARPMRIGGIVLCILEELILLPGYSNPAIAMIAMACILFYCFIICSGKNLS